MEWIPRKDHIRIIAIDPGTNTCGFATMELSLVDWGITIVDAVTVSNTMLLRSRRELAELIGEKDAKLQGYSETLQRLLKQYVPDSLVMECPYMGKFAATFGALKEQLMVFRMAAWRWDKRLTVVMIEPSPVKANMGVGGRSGDKTLMLKALRKRLDVSYSDDVKLTDLDEHSVDAICVGLYELDKIKKVFYGNVSPK